MLPTASLFFFSAAFFLAGILWPAVAKAARRRALATTAGGSRSLALGPVHFVGPAVLIAAGMALAVAAEWMAATFL